MEGRKMKKKGIALLLVIGGVIAVFFCMLTLYNEGGTKMISSAKELKINASEIGMGVEEIKSSYVSDPADFFKRGGKRTNQSFIFELGAKLEECGAIDLIRLQLYAKPKEPMLLAGYAADFYVFNDTTGAKKFFDYIKKSDEWVECIGAWRRSCLFRTNEWLARKNFNCGSIGRFCRGCRGGRGI